MEDKVPLALPHQPSNEETINEMKLDKLGPLGKF